MYEHFTERAVKVMRLAGEEARLFGHEYIDTGHILLGLLKEESGVAAFTLRNFGLNHFKASVEFARIIARGRGAATAGKLPQTHCAKKVVERAIEKARMLGHHRIGTEHLLLGLIHDTGSIAAQMLHNLGVKLEEVRAEVLTLLNAKEAEADDAGSKAKATPSPSPHLRSVLVYIAGPISKGDLATNLRCAHDAGTRLMKAGLAVIVPHGSCFWGNQTAALSRIAFLPEVLPSGTTHDDWYLMDLTIVARCDAVLRLPGESNGADLEESEAHARGIPVFRDEDLLLRWAKTRADLGAIREKIERRMVANLVQAGRATTL